MNTNANSSTTSNWLVHSQNTLTQADIESARLDCLILLEDITGKDRGYLLAHTEHEITDVQIETLNEQINRRATHEPLAYIRGKVEFFGREFMINHDTLVPRPESETMIELLKTRISPDENRTIVDVGTGAGALAIIAQLELPDAEVMATDIDESCLEVARQNAKKLGADITFYQGDLLRPLSNLDHQISIILANLPYVPDGYAINQAANHEPSLALFGGPDGLDLYRKLFAQMAKFSRPPVAVFTESLPFQHAELRAIARAAGFDQSADQDLIQIFERSAI